MEPLTRQKTIPPITHQGESVGSSESSKSMNLHYHFDLMVECPDGTRRRAAFKIDAFEAPFEKYDLCSTPLAAMMAGGVMKMGAARIDSDRKRLAQQIAEQLTKTILDAVQSRDLVNGYPKE